MAPIRRQVESLLRQGAACSQKSIQRPCTRLLKQRQWLWTFADVKGVEPTNNAAERALRPAVIWRKGCFGTHSPRGSRFAERMLTVAATLKKQNRSLLDFLVDANHAALTGHPPPSLIPISN